MFSSGGFKSTLSPISITICCKASTLSSASEIAIVFSMNLSNSSKISIWVYSFLRYSNRIQASTSTSTASIANIFSCNCLSLIDSFKSSKVGSFE